LADREVELFLPSSCEEIYVRMTAGVEEVKLPPYVEWTRM
jgi:hypothetical protein